MYKYIYIYIYIYATSHCDMQYKKLYCSAITCIRLNYSMMCC